MALPEEALFGTNTIYVIENGRAKQRQVTVVHRSPGSVLVTGDVGEGAQIVATRLPGIGDRTRVRVANAANAS